MRLTKPNVAKACLPDGKAEAIVFDDELPGFGLRIRIGGKRTWIVQYRLGTKQRRVSLGSTEKIDADEARRRAKGIFARVHLGQDPAVEKTEVAAQASVTVGSIADLYIERRATKRQKPKGLGETKTYLGRHWKPIREQPLQRIKLSTIAARLHQIDKEHGSYAANRARAALSAMFAWAIGEGLCDFNPVSGTNKPTNEKKRERHLVDPETLAVWRNAGDGDFCAICRLLILTAQRREEVGGILWSEIDLAAATWTIRSDRTKNKLPHLVPLSTPALEILGSLSRREGRDLVFGSGRGGFSGWSKAKIAIDARIQNDIGLPLASWRLHDLRRTVATRMGEIGVLPHIIEAVLNHISGTKAGVAGVYNHATYAAEKRAALDLWSAALMKMLAGDIL